jgi:hypothetical protein
LWGWSGVKEKSELEAILIFFIYWFFFFFFFFGDVKPAAASGLGRPGASASSSTKAKKDSVANARKLETGLLHYSFYYNINRSEPTTYFFSILIDYLRGLPTNTTTPLTTRY